MVSLGRNTYVDDNSIVSKNLVSNTVHARDLILRDDALLYIVYVI